MANLFTASIIDSGRNSALTAQQLQGSLGGASIYSFPPGIGGHRDSDKNGKHADHIPFVVFAPYVSQFYSIDQEHILEKLPPPTFAIALPIPTSALKTEYGIDYDSFNMGAELGSIGTGLKNASDMFKNQDIENRDSSRGQMLDELGKGLTNSIKAGVGNVLFGASGILEEMTHGIYPLESVAKKIMGVQQNPFTETLFKKVEFREHHFNYDFQPRSHEESVRIDEIIGLFRFYMHPAVKSDVFFSFPYEFNIAYSVSDTTFRLLPSVLESMEVDYGGNLDTPKFFATDDKGRQFPTKIEVKLKFREIMIITRDRLLASPESPEVRSEMGSSTNFKRYRF